MPGAGYTLWQIGYDSVGRFLEVTAGPVRQIARWIPPGRFRMGAPEDEPGRFSNEGPQHEVVISRGFWLFDTACSQALWRCVMNNNPSRFFGDDRPVEQVSWNDVQAFLTRLNARSAELRFDLPSEAQWEYACRAKSTAAYATGSSIGSEDAVYLDDAANPLVRAQVGTIHVRHLRPNDWGLYHMHGNVWDWCKDGLRTYEAGSISDPLGPTTAGGSRVVRGGSWGCDAQHLRAAYRSEYPPGNRNGHLSFRCVCRLLNPEP